ncbi:MAG: DNA-3-methyladenine glycosylase family protein [Anaerovoracaceae bacterium]
MKESGKNLKNGRLDWNKIICEGNAIKICDVKNFDIVQTFECGQCFRWNKSGENSYVGVVGGHVVSMSGSGNDIVIAPCTEEEFYEVWLDYFDLERHYGEVIEQISKGDEVMKKASTFGYGIRLLHQDVWETVISFIISQNSNIPRIKKCIETLCSNFGESLGNYRDKEYFSFPDAKRLAALEPEDLAVCKLGYRDRYILETAQSVAADGGSRLSKLREVSSADAEKYLRSLTGVGPKVADCILLFGALKYDSFPVDVWMRRVMATLYGFDENDMKGMRSYAAEKFGEYSGFAQQYLFYYMRENAEALQQR